MTCVQGILLDEASGVSRSQQPVMPTGYQPPKIVVSSWNRKVTFSARHPPFFDLATFLIRCRYLISCGGAGSGMTGGFSSLSREENATPRPFAFYMLKTSSGHNSSSRTKWITATLLSSLKSSSNPMQRNLCRHVSVLKKKKKKRYISLPLQPAM